MDLARFLEPHAEPSPAGVDLDAEGDILTLDMLARWSSPEQAPDWRELQTTCLAALEKSRDLRPAAYLTAALLHTESLEGFAGGLRLQRELLESDWENLHPLPDEDGDATERANALFNLTNFHKVLKPLRMTPLVEDRAVGRFSLFDIELAEGKAEAPDDYEGDLPRTAVIQAAFQAGGGEALQARSAAVARAIEDLAAIEAVFRDRCGAEQAPDLSRLTETLGRIDTALRAYMPAAAGEEAEATGDVRPVPDNPGHSAVPPASVGNGEICTRQDAVAAMDSIARYFRTQEPSSPVPLLMERAKRLVDMDFLSILQDVAPDAVDQVKRLRGMDREE